MENKRLLTLCIVISLLIHVVLVVLGIYYLNKRDFAVKDNKEEIIEVMLKDGKLRIADIPKPAVEQKPEKPNFQGLYDQKVKEETVTNKFERAPGRPEIRGGMGAEKAKKEIKSHPKTTESFGMKDLKEETKKIRKGQNGMEGSRGAIPEDFYPDIKRGGHTYINVLKHMDVAYFVQLKRIFKTTWDPAQALMKEQYAHAIQRGKITVVVGLAINANGTLDELFVINGSGMSGYDNEAIRTVRSSSPFSSPPKQFLESDGKLRLSWTFIVYV